jgi:tetratricopeptide (TPR) repeat protein
MQNQPIDIPKSLLDGIFDGNVILFLGSGASYGAVHPNNAGIPQGQELSDLIVSKYLDDSYKGKPLQVASELAISERDLFEVQSFIADIFDKYAPAPHHKLIPTFIWHSIFTTNYDLILERAYNECKDRAQELAVCKRNGEKMASKFSSKRNVLYLKLHGCITDIGDDKLPLILTPDQYLTHKKGRSRLFERLKEHAYEYPILFIGTSLTDPDIRAILLELSEQIESRPRSYMVGPKIQGAELRFWESKKITSIQLTFENFLKTIDQVVMPQQRKMTIAVQRPDHPIQSRFVSSTAAPISQSLNELLSTCLEYIHPALQSPLTDPKAFYKGYFTNWDPLLRDFDVKRTITDSLLSEIFLEDEITRESMQQLFLLKGHAGSGKSVILKRLAWDAAVLFDKVCLFVIPGANISYYALSELYNLCKQRLFVFVDPAGDNVDLIKDILDGARREKIPITIVTAERLNEWNDCCTILQQYLSQDYHLKYLHDTEISKLIEKLREHNSLGFLEGLPADKQHEAFKKIAGRHLLVALHEATLGKPFSEIILDEYKSISSEQAKSLYLTVSILHRLGVPVRAGLISRVHGVSFNQFKEKLFKPLEFVVFAIKDNKVNDFAYQTRHPYIAEMVFEQVLNSDQSRFDEYIRIIQNLDIDYYSDSIGFKGLLNAKSLLRQFRDPQMIRDLFALSTKRSSDDHMLIQQMAIFEMTSANGSMDRASRLLHHASRLAPWSKPIVHSLAELSLKKSETARTELEKEKFLKEAHSTAGKLTKTDPDSSHAYHTLIKIETIELKELLRSGDTTTIERAIKSIESSIQRAKQTFPDDPFIFDAESRYSEIVEDEPRAFEAIQKAFNANKRSPYVAIRLASLFQKRNNLERAESTLRESLELNPSDKDMNYRLATLLLEKENPDLKEIRHYLRRAFTNNDNRLLAQFAYARVSFILNELEEATRIFSSLKNAKIDIEAKRKATGIVYTENNVPELFHGTLSKIEHSFAFLNMDRTQASVFIYRFHDHTLNWESLHVGNRVKFNLGFTYRGPIALNVLVID